MSRQLLLCLSFVVLIWVMLFACLTQEEAALRDRERREREAYLADSIVTLVFAGDVMGHSPMRTAAYNPATGAFEFRICYQYVEPYIQEADLACANMEFTLAGKPYTSFPSFSFPDEMLYTLQDVGFDVIFTANNHVLDHGKKGVDRTIRKLDSIGIAHAGSYVDADNRDTTYPLVMEVKGMKIGFLNMTYGTNGIPVRKPSVINLLDTVEVARDFERLSELGVDLKVVYVHWGVEYQLKSNYEQHAYAKFLVRQGADLIIGGHPHVPQDADTLYTSDGKPVVTYYSMGNFISNQKDPDTKGGIMIRAQVNRFTGRVIATDYMPYYVHKGTIHGKYQYYIIPTIQYFDRQYDFSLSKSDSAFVQKLQGEIIGRLGNFTLWTN